MRPAGSFATYLPILPFDFLRWWFIEATVNLVKILVWIFKAVIQLLSLESVFKTFFKPWKNEYREGLTRFSIFFGVGFKSFYLLFSAFFLFFLAVAEFFIFLLWLVFPIVVLWGFYAQFFA